ncbi:MAG: hypothetical protein SFV54_08265 [Bryobacteraceae bacterium]|nr:hypothetical protein [Bryobacteraceae bacterium]
MSTLVMVRTECCESYKCGEQCSNCPNRPENGALVEQFKAQPMPSLGRRFRAVFSPTPAPPQPQPGA